MGATDMEVMGILPYFVLRSNKNSCSYVIRGPKVINKQTIATHMKKLRKKSQRSGWTVRHCLFVLLGGFWHVERTKILLTKEWLRTNIFHTRVEPHGTTLNLIIDNGSGMNIISQEAVNKFKCPIEKHLKSYKVSWVDDTSIPVQSRCLVSLSLGKKLQG